MDPFEDDESNEAPGAAGNGKEEKYRKKLPFDDPIKRAANG